MNKPYLNLDANESVFFARELEFIKSQTFDILYPEYKATRLIPVSNEAGAGAQSITYTQFDRVGIMKIIADWADDLPRSDVKGVQFTSPVRSLGGSFGWNVQEIRASMMANKNLDSRKAAATRQSYEQEINEIGWLADGTPKFGGLRGVFFNANVTKATPTNGNWIAGLKTSDQIIFDVNESVRKMRDLTQGVEEPDTILLPVDEFTHLQTTPRATGTDTTILTFLQRVHPGITFEFLNEAKGVVDSNGNKPSGTAGASNVMLTYRRSLQKLSFEIPQDYEQFAAQERGLEFLVPAHARNGGVIFYYPLSATITEGI